MRLHVATNDPHSHKVYKILKFGVNRPNSKKDTAVWKCQNLIYKEMYGHPDAVRRSVRMPYIFFVNFDAFKSLYLSGNYPD